MLCCASGIVGMSDDPGDGFLLQQHSVDGVRQLRVDDEAESGHNEV